MSANFGSPALNAGITLESFQLVGTIPDDRDWLNSNNKYWEMAVEQALSIWVDIPSGPEADFTLSDWMIIKEGTFKSTTPKPLGEAN